MFIVNAWPGHSITHWHCLQLYGTYGIVTQEADRLDCSTSMPKVVVGVPRVLKVFSWGFIYKFHKKIGLGPKTSVQTGAITPSMIENFEKNEHILTKLKNDENGKKSKN